MHDPGITSQKGIHLIFIKGELVKVVELLGEPAHTRSFLELAQPDEEPLSEEDTFDMSGDSEIIATMLVRVGRSRGFGGGR